MRIQAVVILALIALTACGGGEEKKAFADYEQQVDPLLKENSQLWERQFAEAAADLLHYGATEELSAFIRKTLAPFTARLSTGVRAVKPAGEDLAEIHALLLDYVQLRTDFIAVFDQVEALEAGARTEAAPIRQRLDKMMEEVVRKGQAIQPAFQAAPEFARTLGDTLNQILGSAQQFEQMMQALGGGLMPSAQYVQDIDGKVLPWLARMKLRVASLEPDANGERLQVAVLAYLNEMEGLIKASRPLAEVRAKAEKAGLPIQQRLMALRNQADQTLVAYTEEAKAYRDRLR